MKNSPEDLLKPNGASSPRCKLWDGGNPEHIKEAAAALRRGLPVAFPTETVYGLGAIASDDDAVARVFAAKGRPSDNPLIVHVADGEAGLRRVCKGGQPPEIALRLARRFWPGPLSICVRANTDAVGAKTRAGLDTVAIRVPDHPVALALLRELGGDVPVAAPSANASGRPSPTLAAHVLEDLGGAGAIAGVLSGEPVPASSAAAGGGGGDGEAGATGAAGGGGCGVGIESTVVDCSGGPVTILRPGKITREQLEAFLGQPVAVHVPPASPLPVPSRCPPISAGPADAAAAAAAAAAGPRAPGMKYRHYAPRAPLRLVTSPAALAAAVTAAAAAGGGGRVGVMAPGDVLASAGVREAVDNAGAAAVRCGEAEGDSESAGRELYAALRAFDALPDVTLILALTMAEEGLGAALMNRLRKASLAADDLPPSPSP